MSNDSHPLTPEQAAPLTAEQLRPENVEQVHFVSFTVAWLTVESGDRLVGLFLKRCDGPPLLVPLYPADAGALADILADTLER